MIRRLHLVCWFVALALCATRLAQAAPVAVTGVVRDAAGTPQVGALVQLLTTDLTIVSSVYTDSKGKYRLPAALPGHYAVKAMATSFLPAMRENVHVHSTTVVNLTLNTLYEVMQWLPASPRAGVSTSDDWKWTLRSAANRPLLRWLEDGPLVVVEQGDSHRRLKARLMATGQDGSFGESGERYTAAVETTPSQSRELLAQVEFDPNSTAGLESMLGFRQDLGYAGAVQSMATVSLQPEVGTAQASGITEVAVEGSETIHLGDEFDIEAGSRQILAHLAEMQTALATLPFASLGWHSGNSTVRYRLTTLLPAADGAEAPMPRLGMHDGKLSIERGLHQELGFERHTDNAGVSVYLYHDHRVNPVVEGWSPDAVVATDLLSDPASGLLRAAADDFSTTGFEASVSRRLPGGNQVRLSYANGDALTMLPQPKPATLAQVFASARPRHQQTYSITLSGTLEGSGTRWRASYRWQADDTASPVAAYALDASSPYLNLHLRQPVRLARGVEVDALLDVRNLLAQGYQPVVLQDGSLLVVAEQQRSLRAGLAFTF